MRLQQRGHILDADRVATQILQPLGHGDKLLRGMQRAGRVADRSLRMLAGLLDCGDRTLQVANVIQRVEDAEDVHAGLRRLGDETLDDVILVVPIAEQVLPAQQHLETRIRHQLAEGAQPLPRIFVQEANAAIEGRSAPALHRPVARLIQISTGRNHVFYRHPRRHQALMGVPENQLCHINIFCHFHPSRLLTGEALHRGSASKFPARVKRRCSYKTHTAQLPVVIAPQHT